MYFQPRILDVTEVFVLKYCPLWLNITSKSETEMFSMNNQRQMFHLTCESLTVTQRVTKGHQIAVHLQPERRRLLTIKQRNQIILKTVVDFASISYLNFSRLSYLKFSRSRIIKRQTLIFTGTTERTPNR